jgi:hypothetical protein
MEHQEPNKWERPLARSEGEADFLQNSIVQTLLLFSLIPIVGCLGLLAYFIRPGEASIVLHYNVYFGVDLLGLWWQAYALPVLAMLFVAGHFFLARRFYERAERVACYLMLFSSGMLSAGVLVAGMSVAFINY